MKDLNYGTLLDYYGGLLTDKQADIMQRYYDLDFSLGEIAEQLNVTRQSVRGTLLKAQTALDAFEAKLHLAEKLTNVSQRLKEILPLCVRDVQEEIRKIIGELEE